jgi:hypothetical protein
MEVKMHPTHPLIKAIHPLIEPSVLRAAKALVVE